MATLFDTHAAIQKLKDAGFTEQQAEAQVHVLLAIMAGNVPTKHDLAAVETTLKHEIALLEERTKGRFTLLQWMIGFNIALTVIVLAKLFS